VTRKTTATWPVAGLLIAFVTLSLWLYAPAFLRLDLLCGLLCLTGFGLSVVGYTRGVDLRTRRLSVVALGANLVGLGLLALFYVA
jgi:hypothetical protein